MVPSVWSGKTIVAVSSGAATLILLWPLGRPFADIVTLSGFASTAVPSSAGPVGKRIEPTPISWRPRQ
jgi:hypothetical protein